MRYILKPTGTKGTIFDIVDTKPKESWDNNIVTVYELKGSKVKRVDLVINAINLHNELNIKPEKKTKQQLLEIIKKYQLK